MLVVGLDSAPPEIVFSPRHASRLKNFRHLMEGGIYSPLQSIIPPITIPAWACMFTGLTPGHLGIYGIRNRKDYSYEALQFATSHSLRAKTLWNALSDAGKSSLLIGVPPSYPPPMVRGNLISCFLTPDNPFSYTYPPELKEEIESRFARPYPTDVRDFRTENKSQLLQQIYDITEIHFQVLKYLLMEKEWDLAVFVEMGTDRIHHGFWKFFDETHPKFQPGNPFQNAIPDYYAFLDEKVGEILALLDEGTTVLIVSDHGAKRLDGGFCINEWLIKEGYLRLKREPKEVTRFSASLVDWAHTCAWGEGGYYARLYINLQSREPQGVVKPHEYESLCREIKQKLESEVDDRGRLLRNQAFLPHEIYPVVNGIPPDLILLPGDLYWRSIGSIGYSTLWTPENDTGPDDANHAMEGVFIAWGRGISPTLASPCLSITEVAGFIAPLLTVPFPGAIPL